MPNNRIKSLINCAECHVKNICIVGSLPPTEVSAINDIITNVKMIKKGSHIFHMQEDMPSLHAVYKGSIKSYWLDEHGEERIENFYLAGDIIGLESIHSRKHRFSAIALEETVMCLIPLDALFELMQKSQEILKRFISISGYKMQNDKYVSLATNSKQRLADFILNILYRMQERNIYHNHIPLPMTQLDIAHFLGMTHETVNRLLREFSKLGILELRKKKIFIDNINTLTSIGTPMLSFGQQLE